MVRWWIARNEYNLQERPLETRLKTGRPKATAAQEDRNMAQVAEAMPFTSSILIKEQLQLNCNPANTRRRLHSEEIYARLQRK